MCGGVRGGVVGMPGEVGADRSKLNRENSELGLVRIWGFVYFTGLYLVEIWGFSSS